MEDILVKLTTWKMAVTMDIVTAIFQVISCTRMSVAVSSKYVQILSRLIRSLGLLGDFVLSPYEERPHDARWSTPTQAGQASSRPYKDRTPQYRD